MILKKKYIWGQVLMILVAGSAFAVELDASMELVGEQVEVQGAVTQNIELSEQHRNRHQARMQEMKDEHMNSNDAVEHHLEVQDEMHEEHVGERDSMRDDHMSEREGRREHDASGDDLNRDSAGHDGGNIHH